ncbi:hypothetical protein [Ramlibacter albus]|uniref:Uncharacterized protein n=1 Tax=Ramlibacter albus TaxID=2079448 RepID=A0A923MFL3_9BURK|nr:hypothetical protein [Ramlibacter albus]MBC5768092.1 hypothetical protein [Ramlibacter albus]
MTPARAAANVVAAEAAALKRDEVEEAAYARFSTARAAIEREQNGLKPTDTKEFLDWMAARRATDEAWGAWAVAMEAQADF